MFKLQKLDTKKYPPELKHHKAKTSLGTLFPEFRNQIHEGKGVIVNDIFVAAPRHYIPTFSIRLSPKNSPFNFRKNKLFFRFPRNLGSLTRIRTLIRMRNAAIFQ